MTQAQTPPSAYLKGIQAGKQARQQDQARAPYQQAASVCPRCFTPEQWVLWRTPHHSVRVPAKHCCEDCTPEYQAEMLAAKRCDHPETTFIRDADGFISGHRPPITNQEKS